MIRVLSLFSGIGAPEKALKQASIPYTLTNFCEKEPEPIAAYCSIHNIDPALNLGDITAVNVQALKPFDLVVWGFPCQDLSRAKVDGKGLEGERSGLYSNGLEIVKLHKPKYSVIENVASLGQPKWAEELERMKNDLTEAGYDNYIQIVNSIDYATAQVRNRIFIVSIRKDLEQSFTFPEGTDGSKVLADILEENVTDEWYYYKSPRQRLTLKKNYIQADQSGKGYNSQQDRFYYSYVPMGTIAASNKGDKHNVAILNPGYEVPTGDYTDEEVQKAFTFRKLTPLECFKLMGFDKEDFEAAQKVVKKRPDLYKMAGNSIVVPVLTAIFKNLLTK